VADTTAAAPHRTAPPLRVYLRHPHFALDHYSVLGVAADASVSELRQAYKERSLVAHPDRSSGSEAAFHRVSTAYEVLRLPAMRVRYDEGDDIPRWVLHGPSWV
jgi:hypothetical protein